jgi:hypothetical protein
MSEDTRHAAIPKSFARMPLGPYYRMLLFRKKSTLSPPTTPQNGGERIIDIITRKAACPSKSTDAQKKGSSPSTQLLF